MSYLGIRGVHLIYQTCFSLVFIDIFVMSLLAFEYLQYLNVSVPVYCLSLYIDLLAATREKVSLGFPNRSNTNRAEQLPNKDKRLEISDLGSRGIILSV